LRFDEEKAYRELLMGRLAEEDAREAVPPHWVRQHELLPCVRRGVLTRRFGPQPNRRSALYFLRGRSAEAIIAANRGIRTVYKGVVCTVDWWDWWEGDSFVEIKSTNLSSSKAWQLTKLDDINLNDLQSEFLPWFVQCAVYCIAFGVNHCRLVVFFLHGDYGDRRTKCPECDARDLADNRLYRECRKCGYKSYKIDLRSYRLTFSPEELAAIEAEVFDARKSQFWQALQDGSMGPPTPNHLCWDCEAGRLGGCEFYRRAA